AVFYAVAMVVTRQHCRNEHPLVLALGLNVAFLVAAVIGGIASVSPLSLVPRFYSLHGRRLAGRRCFLSSVTPVP
ncbi:hypothetical protein, partial [Pseudomonas sp. PDM31]|uniref:hypothetical protein n=1 Tax=Pseudomonas sp. PDM31 TaxID=2854778 RepID=UPI003528C860|nr:hypothetical protein [Pseudomonas sp. PDM31]